MTATTTDPSVTTTRTIRVDTGDLRNAVRSVVVHAKKTTLNEDAAEHRLRLHVDLPGAPKVDGEGFADGSKADTWLRLMATNGITTACALVQVLEDDAEQGLNRHDGPYVVDVLPHDGRHILWAFKSARAGVEGLDETLEMRMDVERVAVRDVGGLWAGHGITMPQLPFSTAFPDLHETSKRALATASTPATPGREMVVDGDMLALFRVARRVYEQPLQIKPIGVDRGAGWLVTCGARFVGTIASDHDSDGPSLGRRSKYVTDLLQRFGLGQRAEVDVREPETADA